MHLIWVQKIAGSSPAALIAKSHNGSVGVCKTLGIGSIPILACWQVAEWLNAAVLKTVILCIVGSNPTLPIASLA